MLFRSPYESDGARSVVDFGISGLPYSTLGSGFLSGKYQEGQSVDSMRAQGVTNNYANPENFGLLKRLTLVAEKMNVSNTALALAWLRMRQGVTVPLASGRTIEQLHALMQKVDLSPEDAGFIAGK